MANSIEYIKQALTNVYDSLSAYEDRFFITTTSINKYGLYLYLGGSEYLTQCESNAVNDKMLLFYYLEEKNLVPTDSYPIVLVNKDRYIVHLPIYRDKDFKRLVNFKSDKQIENDLACFMAGCLMAENGHYLLEFTKTGYEGEYKFSADAIYAPDDTLPLSSIDVDLDNNDGTYTYTVVVTRQENETALVMVTRLINTLLAKGMYKEEQFLELSDLSSTCAPFSTNLAYAISNVSESLFFS